MRPILVDVRENHTSVEIRFGYMEPWWINVYAMNSLDSMLEVLMCIHCQWIEMGANLNEQLIFPKMKNRKISSVAKHRIISSLIYSLLNEIHNIFECFVWFSIYKIQYVLYPTEFCLCTARGALMYTENRTGIGTSI